MSTTRFVHNICGVHLKHSSGKGALPSLASTGAVQIGRLAPTMGTQLRVSTVMVLNRGEKIIYRRSINL
jgi:hypothetical protein